MLFRRSRHGRRATIEDDRGVAERGKDAVKDIERQWQFGGAYIGEEGQPGRGPELPEPLAQDGDGGGQGTKAPARAQGRVERRGKQTRAGAAWTHIAAALRNSSDLGDRTCAAAIEQWVTRRTVARELEKSPPIRSPNVERTR